MAERCGECDVMITIKAVKHQNDKPIGQQYYLVLDNFKRDGDHVQIYEEDLLAMLDRLIQEMDAPIMENVDHSAMYEASKKLSKKIKGKSAEKKRNAGKEKRSNSKCGSILFKGNASSSIQKGTEEEANESEKEQVMQNLTQMEKERIQKEKEKEEKRCKAREDWFRAEQELAEEKAKYSLGKQIEHIFNEKVQPLIPPFLKLMESLIYFAGCLNAEDYSTRKRVLGNRQRMMRGSIQANGWDTILSAEAFQGIDEMLAAMAQEARMPDLPQMSAQLTTEEYQQKKAKTEELHKQYLVENEKLRLNAIRQRQILEYVCLFRELYPVIKKICTTCESEIEEQWALSIGNEIIQLVDSYQSKKANMKFVFIYPDDNIISQNEPLKMTFIAAETNCPGLFYIDSDSGEPVCVIPGRIK